ncbi:Synaptotagmin-17 [Armadillidium vulgare]|nr:Synaptotagmin-17 [Armadillidium vulgare]
MDIKNQFQNIQKFQNILQIRPQLYESTSSSADEVIEEENLGRIHFAFHYDVNDSVFVVRVIEAVELPPPANKDRLDQASSNPYVRVSLLPDISNVKETAVKKKTQDPIFEETFAFKQTIRNS